MASRFFVASSSDYDEEEQEQEKQEEEDQDQDDDEQEKDEENKPKKKTNKFFDDDWRRSENRKVLTEKQKRWAELQQCTNVVNDELAAENYQQAFTSFQKLIKITDKSKKAIDEHGYPNFFILGMKEMYEKVKEKADVVKQLKRFNAELDKFIVPFKETLQEAIQHPEDFADEEEEDDEFGFGNLSDSDNSSSEDEGPGKWFKGSESSSDEETDTKKDKTKKIKINKQSDKDYADMIEERLREAKNENITDETAKIELAKDVTSRNKGKIITTTDRLSVLLHSVTDSELQHQIKLEICYTMMQGPSDVPIPFGDWSLALKIIPSLTKDAELIVPLFERLNRDFWARSVDPRIVFTAETTKLHNLLKDFLSLMNQFTDILEEEEKFNFCTRLQILILEHNYHELAPPYEERVKQRRQMSQQEVAEYERNQQLCLKARTPRELCRSILNKVPPEGLFDPQTSLSIRTRAMLFYAIHLALNGHPIQAQQLVAVLPEIPDTPYDFQFVRILCHRAYAEIGIAAFMTGEYRLAYNSLKSFFVFGTENPLKTTRAMKLLGQQPRIYAPWLYIDINALETYLYLSIMILDTPCLTTFNFDDNSLLINPKLHKELQKKVGITVCPETIIDKVAVAIERCKRGEWKLALDVLHYEIERYIPDPTGFIKDVKLVSLCSFLMTANQFYDAVQIDTLKKQFELEKKVDPVTGAEIESNDVELCLHSMSKQRSPVCNVLINFNAQVDSGFVSFIHAEQESPLAEFGRTLKTKSEILEKSLQELIIDPRQD